MSLRIATLTRVLGFLLGGFFAVSLAVLLFIWVSFDSSRVSTTLSQYFRDQYQRSLRIGEAPRLRLRPLPVLELGKLSLSEPGKSEVFATLDALSLDLELVPLLLRQTVVKGARLTKAEIHFVRSAAGSWNASDLLAGGIGLQALPWPVQIERLHVNDSTLKLSDLATASHFVLSDVSLLTGALRDKSPGSFALRGVALGEAASGDEVKLRAEGRYTLADQLVAGRIDQLNVRLDGDAWGLKGATGSFQAAGVMWQNGGQRIDLASGALSLRGALGEQALDFSAELPALGREGLGVRGKDWKARLVVRARDRETRFEASLPAPTSTEQGFKAETLGVKLAHRIGKHALALEALSPLAVDFDQGGLSAPAARGTLVADYAALKAGKASLPFKAQLAWLRGRGELPGKTTLSLALSHGRDTLHASADLQGLWPLAGQLALASNRFDLGGVFAPAGFHTALRDALPALVEAKLNGTLGLTQFRLDNGLRLGSLKSPFALAGGRMTLPGIEAELYRGRLGGDVAIEAASGRFTSKGEFSELALGPLAKDIQQRLPFSGDLSGSFVFNGEFKPGIPLAEHLQGAVRWKLQNGALQGFDLARSLRDFRSAIRSVSATARTPAASEQTPVTTASSRFVLDHGKLQAENIIAANDWLSLSGSGSADLQGGELDFALGASLSPRIANTAARDLADLRGKPLPIRLKGKLTRPDVRFEPALKIAASALAGKAVANKAKQ
ncbi:MAG: AsmA family protein [Uliginosibacterium sp.]|nr:AsmA family protein [Uliginosibacterium sp.]